MAIAGRHEARQHHYQCVAAKGVAFNSWERGATARLLSSAPPRTHEAGQSQSCLICLTLLHPLSLSLFQKPAEEFTTERPKIQPNSWPTRPRLVVGRMGA